MPENRLRLNHRCDRKFEPEHRDNPSSTMASLQCTGCRSLEMVDRRDGGKQEERVMDATCAGKLADARWSSSLTATSIPFRNLYFTQTPSLHQCAALAGMFDCLDFANRYIPPFTSSYPSHMTATVPFPQTRRSQHGSSPSYPPDPLMSNSRMHQVLFLSKVAQGSPTTAIPTFIPPPSQVLRRVSDV